MKRVRYLLVAALTLAGVALWFVKSTASSATLESFAKERQSSFLLYAELSNRIVLVERGAVRSLDTGGGGKYLDHHAYPTISASGRAVVFVRPSDTHGFEDMILYDLPKHEERLLLHWPGSIWSMAWDPSGSHLAFVADKGSGYERNTRFYLLDAASGHVDDLTPGTGWVSAYSTPSWSPSGDRIAFEKYSRTVEADLHTIMILDVITKSIASIADGWFPSWSPDENKLAYITFNGGRCYEVDLRSNRRRLM